MQRKTCVVAVCVLAATLAAGEDTTLERAKAEAAKRWGANIREVSAIESPHLKQALKGAACFRCVVYNPKSVRAGRPTFPHALILWQDGTDFIEDDAAAVAALSKQGIPVADATEAQSRLLAFAEIRGNTLCEDTPGKPGVDASDWKPAVQQREEGWSISCVLMTDPNIGLCLRYEFLVTKDGKVTATPGKVEARSGGYR